MAVMYSYNGAKLPALPDWCANFKWVFIMFWTVPNDKYVLFGTNDMAIGKISGQYVWLVARESNGTSSKYKDGEWAEANTYANYMIYFDDPIWTNTDLYGTEDGETLYLVLPASTPVPVNATLEATYTGNLEVTAFGATGIIVGAQVRDNETGTVIDISDEAEYSIFSVGAEYASLDENRQLIIDEDCPLDSIRIEITWDELPDQTATLTVFINIDSGGEGGEDPDNPDVPVDPEEPEVTAEALRASFWRGFGSGVGMYGGAVVVSGEAVATSESGGSGSELTAAFWKGFASGAAMYGKGVI